MYLAYFATYERIWHILPLTNVSGIFCHLQTHLAFFATYMYERILHFLLHICHARQREEVKAMAANYSLTLVLSMLFISIGLSVAIGLSITDNISCDELIE